MTGKRGKTKVDELKEALERRKRHGGSDAASGVPDTKDEKQEGQQEDIDLDELTNQLSAAEQEAKTHYDKLLRVMAELDNFKKRSNREKQEMIRYGNENLISDLLPVLDDMDRVLEHMPEGASKELIDFVSGVQLVAKQFFTILTKYGLTEIKTTGEKFNPEIHEAVAHPPSDEVEADYIVDVHRKGYMLNDRVIRAAMVSVSKGGS